MAPIVCCGFRRPSSPDLPPIKLAEIPQENGRLVGSKESPIGTSPTSLNDAKPIHEIFASASNAVGSEDSAVVSGHDHLGTLPTSGLLHREESSKKLHDVAARVHKRMSRDSEVSKRSSKRSLRDSLSAEDIARRQKLKRARRQRLQTDLLEDPSDKEDGFDDDAVPIKTPGSTFGRRQGSVRLGPDHLSRALDRSTTRSLSPTPQSDPESDSRKPSQVHRSNNMAGALTRILTQRASNLENNPVEGTPDESSVDDHTLIAKRSNSKNKYVFTSDTPRKLSNRSTSPPIREESTTTYLSPVALRLYSISDSVTGPDWQPHSPGSRRASTRTKASSPFRSEATGSAVYENQSEDIAPVRAAWLRGASGLMADSLVTKPLGHGDHYETDSDEQYFGGVDGQGLYTESRKQSDDNNAVHLYNMHIPLELATQSLVTSPSSSKQQGKSTGDHSFKSGLEYFDINPRQHSSSSENANANAVGSWHSSAKHALSSEYSSRSHYESLAASRQSSIARLGNLADRLDQLKQHRSGEHIISVPADRRVSIDFDKWEAGTINSNNHDSNDSWMKREMAAAKTRTQPMSRANTVPKNSRFNERFSQEDFDDIVAELARTHPRRQSYNGLDGSDELRPPGGHGDFLAPPNYSVEQDLRRSSSSSRRDHLAPQRNQEKCEQIDPATHRRSFLIPPGDQARGGSVWDIALREHANKEHDLRRSSSSSWRGHLAPQRNQETHEQTSPTSQRRSFLIPPGDQARGGSVWDIALREHAEEDAKIRKRRPGSISFDLDQSSRGRGRRISRQSSSLRHVQDSSSSEIHLGDSLQAQLKAFKMPAKSSSILPVLYPYRTPSRTPSPRPVGTWSRFPSHTREERSSSPAGDEDSVLVRDFAKEHSASDVAPDNLGPLDQKRPLPLHLRRKARSMSFRTQVIEPLTRLYRSVSLELRSKSAFDSYGHRSSISGGISAEFPELEMLPSISPPVIEEGETSEMLMEALGHTIPSPTPKLDNSVNSDASVIANPKPSPKPEEDAKSGDAQLSKNKSSKRANVWSKLYEDCLTLPRDFSIEPKSSPLKPIVAVDGAAEDFAPMYSSRKEPEMRASTLDFGRKLEQEEKGERERILRLTRSDSHLMRRKPTTSVMYTGVEAEEASMGMWIKEYFGYE